MIDYSEAKRFIAALPWASARVRPLLQLGTDEGRAVVRLYDARRARVLTCHASAPETALRAALAAWVGPAPGIALDAQALAVMAGRLRCLVN